MEELLREKLEALKLELETVQHPGATKQRQLMLSVAELDLIIQSIPVHNHLDGERKQILLAVNKRPDIAAELASALNSLILSVMAHPDYTGEDNAEWTDLIETAEEVLTKYNNQSK